MNKLILYFMLCSFSISAQQFKLTPTGFVSKEDTSKNYVVLQYDGKTQSEIYNDVLTALNAKYVSAQTVLSKVENRSITINARGQKVRRTSMHSFDNDYTIVLAFKDGKMKVEAPVVRLTSFAAGHLQEMHLTYGGISLNGSHFGIFKKSGKVKYKKTVEDLETFANDFIAQLHSNNLNRKESW